MISDRGESSCKHYDLWLGICFLWGPGGPIATGNSPNPHSSNQGEKIAVGLCQKDIQNASKDLDIYFTV